MEPDMTVASGSVTNAWDRKGVGPPGVSDNSMGRLTR